MIGRNIKFPIKNADGSSFHDLVLHKATYDSVVMSLGDKITGDVYYKDNTLVVTGQEYIEYKQNPDDPNERPVRFLLVDPPTVIREGMVSDNSGLKGMTKYSFTFYHPMYMLGNFPLTDIAVTDNEERYLSQNKTFSWIGTCFDFINKLNKNLENTPWVVVASDNAESQAKMQVLSEVLSFDNNTIADAFKTAYETWDVPYVIDTLKAGEYYDDEHVDYYSYGKRFVALFGLPSNEIVTPISDHTKYKQNGTVRYAGAFYWRDLPIYLPKGGGVRIVNDGSYKSCRIVRANVSSATERVTAAKIGSTLTQGEEYMATENMYVVLGFNSSAVSWNYQKYGAQNFVFEYGKGVGLKNNSRTPKNNKIITRIAGYGSEDNVPYGYPQIPWTGNPDWEYTINNDSTNPRSYPIYKGIVGGQWVKLIKHPFTRKHLMPSIYADTVRRKVDPNAQDYNPDEVIIDYYDATSEGGYPNPIVPDVPSYEIHEFEKIKPQLGDAEILDAYAINTSSVQTSNLDDGGYISEDNFHQLVNAIYGRQDFYYPAAESLAAFDVAVYQKISGSDEKTGGAYNYEWSVEVGDGTIKARYVSDRYYINKIVVVAAEGSETEDRAPWIDDIDDEGNYVQSYFKIKLPSLSFDLYASAAITQEMEINMRSGACIGCTFTVQIDWEDYKKNFYDADGNFDPVIGEGHPRDGSKYPNSYGTPITVIVQKETDTFGTLMPNIYQQPMAGDKFVILGISLPLSYITIAQQELDEAMKQYMLENNIHYFDYPLKFDEYFFATHTDILQQIRNNTIVRFRYGNEPLMALYVKQITIKYGDNVLPQYDITLTDDVEIVLNQIGQVTDDVSRVRLQLSELQKYYGTNIDDLLNEKLSRIADDVALGKITFQQGLDALNTAIFREDLKSPDYESGLYDGRGWRIDSRGNAEFESIRVRSYLEVVELLINRLQAQEGDTMFTDNDQIDKVEKEFAVADTSQISNPKEAHLYESSVTETGETIYTPTEDTSVVSGKVYYNIASYLLTLKEKYDGYFTPQMQGNVLKGIINTLAAKQGGVSDEEHNNPSKQGTDDGGNKYYTSWMRVIGTRTTDNNLGNNQIRVILYGDSDVPSGKNFAPCELMTIARWGCIDYSDPTAPDYEEVKASIEKRQRMFMISVSEGRVTKYTGVDSPKLKNGNYGVTIGELPDFVKNYPDVQEILQHVGVHTDWLYAQGIVVGNFVKVDKVGLPITNYVDCGEWVNGGRILKPTKGHGIYLYNEYNEDTLQWETHDVWWDGAKWRCLQHQPVVSGGFSMYYKPSWNSPYWRLVEGDKNFTVEFTSNNGSVFAKNSVNTTISAHVYFGNKEITNEIDAANFYWVRRTGTSTDIDSWTKLGVKQITITDSDMTAGWSPSSPMHFYCYVIINNSSYLNSTYSGFFTINQLVNGESSFVVDIDNEIVSVNVDGNNEIISPSATIPLKITAYYGSRDVTEDCAIVESHADSDIDVYIDGGDIEVTYQQGNAMNGNQVITFTVTHSTYGSRRVTFTLAALKGNTTYEILPNISSVVFTRQPDDSLLPASQVLTATIQMNKLGTITNSTISQSGLTVRYSTTGDISSKTDGSAFTNSGITVSNTDTYNKVYLAAFSGNTLVDKETIPIVKDGYNGKDAVFIDLTNESDVIACDSSGKVRYARTITTTAKIYRGSSVVTSGVTANKVKINGVQSTPTISGGTARYSWTFAKDAQMTATSYNATITLTYGGVSYSATFTLTRSDAIAAYQLLPSTNALSFAFVDGAYTPSSLSIYCGYQKIDANGTTDYAGNVLANISKNDGAPYNVFYRWHKDDGTKTSWAWAKDVTNYTVVVPNSTTNTAIEYILCSANSLSAITDATIVDIETIPINKDGVGGVSYIIESTVGSVTIPSDATTGTISTTLSFYKKSGDGNRAAYQCYCTIFKKKGSTYTSLQQKTKAASVTYSNQALNATDYDALVVCIYDAASTSHSGYLAELEIPVRKNGDNGIAGYSTATVYLYKRSATPITATGITGTATYNFANKTLTVNTGGSLNGWTQNIPSDSTDTIYVTAATAFSNEGTDTIAASEWATPAQMAESGGQGEHGINTASVFLYQRKSTAPAKPTGSLTYEFSSGILSGTLGDWVQTIPTANGTPCWVIQATAISSDSTDVIMPSEWSEQRKLVEDGEVWEIQTTTDSETIPQDETSTFVSATASFYRRVGTGTKNSSSSYYGVYKRSNGAYVKLAASYGDSYTISTTVTTSDNAIAIYLFTSSYEGADPESQVYRTKKEIVIYKNGDTGEDGLSAPYLQLSRSAILYKANSNGSSSTTQSYVVNLHLKVNGTDCVISSPNNIVITKPSSVNVTKNSISQITITIPQTQQPISGNVFVTVTGTLGGNTYTAQGIITIEPNYQGEQGDRGKVGRFYYYAGEWINSNTPLFTVSDTEAPFFSYDNGYWVYNPDENGDYSMAKMGAPSPSSNDWEIMVTDFKYLITEAIFGNYAHFGAAIINNDWMISTYGIIDNTSVHGSSNYTKFDPTFITDSIVYAASQATITRTSEINKTYSLISGVTYTFNVIGVNEGGSSVERVMINADGTTHTYSIIGSESSPTTADFTVTPSTTGVCEIWSEASSSSSLAVVTITITASGNYIPNYAVDLATGKTYMNNAYVRGDIVSNRLLASDDNFSTEITAGVTTWTSKTFPLASIMIGADNDGMFFKMTDKDGRLIWDFSTTGNGKITSGGGDYTALYYKQMSGASPDKSEYRKITHKDCTTYLQYNGHWTITNGSKIWQPADEGNKNGLVYTSLVHDEPPTVLITDGYYAKENNGTFPMNINGKYELALYHYISGKLNEITTVEFDTL